MSVLINSIYNLQTDQLPRQCIQQAVLYDPTTVLLVLQRTYQLWNIRDNTKLLQTTPNSSVFYFCYNAFLDSHTVAYISFQMQNTTPYIGTIDLETSQVSKLVDLLPMDLENYEKLFVVQNGEGKGCDIVVSNASRNTVLVLRGGKLEEVNHEGANTVDAYSPRSYVAYSCAPIVEMLGYTLVGDGVATRYNTEIKCPGAVVKAIAYVDQENSVIAYSKDKKTEVCIYNHVKGVVMDVRTIDFDVEYLRRYGEEGWLACRTTEMESSTLEVQNVFGKGEHDVVKCKIPEYHRIESEFHVAFLLKSFEGKTEVNCYTMVQQKSLWTHMIEELGLVEAFGNEIVKATVNHLI